MTRWENTSVYRALGTLSALPVHALSRLPLKAGKRRCGLSFSQWFLLLGMGAMLCVPHGAWNNLYAVLFALAALLVYWFDCAARKDAPRNIGDLGPAALGFLLMTVLCTLWAGNKAGNLRVALFFWTGFLLAYLTAAQFRTRTERRAAAAALYITLLAVSLYGLWNYVTGAEASDVPIDGEMYRRLGATLEHGINCGEFIAMALPVALVWVLTAPTKARRIALTVPLLLPCAAILLTYARTGWIMLALALVLLLWYKKKILLLPAAALGIGALFLLPESLQARFLVDARFLQRFGVRTIRALERVSGRVEGSLAARHRAGAGEFLRGLCPLCYRSSRFSAAALQYAVSRNVPLDRHSRRTFVLRLFLRHFRAAAPRGARQTRKARPLGSPGSHRRARRSRARRHSGVYLVLPAHSLFLVRPLRHGARRFGRQLNKSIPPAQPVVLLEQAA